ncbi:MAG: rhodanese-like domain-containing protein [Thermodesulfobacteriota bacterium]
MEPQEKVLVAKDFLQTSHGEIACEQCHGGDPSKPGKEEAHAGLDPHPSINNPDKACGECHGEIVATAKNSLHATLSTFPTILKSRADMAKWAAIDEARAGHCAACHTSCGGCHVSRPKFAQKGFVAGHTFRKRSDPLNQCTACHGSRVGNEFYGTRGAGDIHAAKADMDCVACHSATEMHAAAPADLPGRYHLAEMVRCEQCHQELEYGSVREHTTHIGKVQCQVCHSQTYVQCYSCHVGKDENGVRYFQNQKEVESMKIGRNYDAAAPDAGYRFMLVRHEPSDLEVFDFYVKDAFTNFDNTPTWKRTSPHNIQRRTWQTATCNHCHGNRDLFLAEKDLLDYEKKANAKVVVADADIPGKIDKTRTLRLAVDGVRASMVLGVKQLEERLAKKDVVVVDARDAKSYAKGHIEGAVHLDPMTAGFRTGADENPPMQMVPDEDVAAILGSYGLKADDHIVVYGRDGREAGFLLWILEYAGAKNVSYLDGGIEAWHEAGHHTATEKTERPEAVFGGQTNKEIVVGNDYVEKNLDNPRVAILDARIIHQFKGISKHDKASRGGHIPGAVNLPLGALYMENGQLKQPAELLWVLKNHGLTPDKTVITTCNTGQLAADAYFILRWLGFQDVRVHDASWISYCDLGN